LRTGAPCTPEEIEVTVGGRMAPSQAFEACLDTGDAAVIFDPCHPPHPGAIRAAGARVRVAPSLSDVASSPISRRQTAPATGPGRS